ncbi:WAP four-disulfide core domain protein 2 isoform X2 [Cynocephalus volans]|uniref:WAP four-disulfide core domain protein 2 isoform X2 n=1 Tax=Cynocephalus volans TaxID=110931 RepID=UPI002FC5AAAF
MPVCRLGPLAAALLGLLLLGLRPVTGAEKAGVCPQLQETAQCTQECVSDSECAGNLKCCRAACSSVCSVPNAPATTSLRSGERKFLPGPAFGSILAALPSFWPLPFPPGLTTASPFSNQ